MFSFLSALSSSKTTQDPPLNQEILLSREEMLLTLCEQNMTQEAISFLQLEGKNINLIYSDGIFFRTSIYNSNQKILSELLNTFIKHALPDNYRYLDLIFKSTECMYLPLEIENIINNYKIYTDNPYKLYEKCPFHFQQFKNFALIQENIKSAAFVSLTLTSDNLNLKSRSETWNILAQEGKYRESLKVINAWDNDVYAKALVIYHYIVSTNHSDIEKTISDIHKNYQQIYLSYLLNISQILDNKQIESLIASYIQKCSEQEEDCNYNNDDLNNHSLPLSYSFGSASTRSSYEDITNLIGYLDNNSDDF